MKYSNITKAAFLSRPNRFIAHVQIKDKPDEITVCHVKNTGRCKELLVPGCDVYLNRPGSPGRKTEYDLITVRKGDRLINMDSQAPNVVAGELIRSGRLFDEDVILVKPETVHGDSRFDFYVETEHEKWFVEVKGVTLEKENIASFPDAPTERGVKHIRELGKAVAEGYRAMILFIVQMEGIKELRPNDETHPEFGKALLEARERGVKIAAYGCRVETDSLTAAEGIPVRLNKEVYLEAFRSDGINEVLQKTVEPLLSWYKEQHRDLAWRRTRDPYRIWISEIMLQQTRVEAVKSYYDRFMEELPTVRHLAEVSDDKLMKLWEGLGYYSRARNLKKAAVMIMEEYGGDFPDSYEGLLRLPGIGAYTAGAIGSIVFNLPTPAVDGNVLRVYSRWLKMGEDIGKEKVKKQVFEELSRVMPKDMPGSYNQALMELGAMICVPNGPAKCGQCPVFGLCRAGEDGTFGEYPKKAPKKERKIEERTVFLIRTGDRWILRKRPERGLLAGLYELPNESGYYTEQEALRLLEEKGLMPLRVRELPKAKHIFSHVEWRMNGYLIYAAETASFKEPKEDLLLVETEKLHKEYSIPSAFKAYIKYLELPFES